LFADEAAAAAFVCWFAVTGLWAVAPRPKIRMRQRKFSARECTAEGRRSAGRSRLADPECLTLQGWGQTPLWRKLFWGQNL